MNTGPVGDRDPEQEAPLADGLERLWTPHRLGYIRGENKPTDSGPGDQCPFCRVPGLSDIEGLIVARGELVFAVLNLYPYNTGHVLICPYRHFADITEATAAELAEMNQFSQRLMVAIRHAMQPHGFNLGVNQGEIAGAGISAHLHQHIVPRWGGDANFMPIVGRTKILPQELADTRRVIAEAWEQSDVGMG
jgi:ATP adenylyltransferase